LTTPPLDHAAPSRFAPRPKIDPRWVRLFWPLLALACLLAFDFLFIPDFFHVEVKEGRLFGSVIDILDRAAPVLLLSIGMTLVIATGGVDLSVGSIMAISAAVAAQAVVNGAPAPAAFGAALGVALLAGLWNGALVALLGIQPIVATLILMVAGRGIAHLITDSQIIPFRSAAYSFLGSGFLFGLPFSLTLVACVLLATAVLVRKTALGLFIEAVGGNATASRYAGVNATAVIWLVYVFSGLCAGIAGLISAGDINAADPNNNGRYLELDAILAVVIGGTALTGGRFSLPGSVIGALVIQTLTTTILTFGVPTDRTLVVKALVVIVVCLLQSEGLREKVAALKRRFGT
jgi:ribose/xylose/arabinose/galactoside ABC-type transport system permease subunit